MKHQIRYMLPLAALAILATACGRRDDTTITTDTAAGTVASAIRVDEIDIGRSLADDRTIRDETDSFRPSDTVFVSVETEGTGQATLAARFLFEDGQVVNESTQNIDALGTTRTEFHVSKPDGWPEGKYRVELLLNGATAGTKEFEVKRTG